MDKMDLFRNLVVMAAIDRRFTQEEFELLSVRAAQLGLSDEQFRSTIDFALSEEAALELPVAGPDRAQMLRELVRMMVVDGELADIEKELFAVAAAQMGIGEAEVAEILDGML